MNAEKLLDDVLEHVANNPGWFGRKLACKELEDIVASNEADVEVERDIAFNAGYEQCEDDNKDCWIDEGRADELKDVIAYLRLDSHRGVFAELAKALEQESHKAKPRPIDVSALVAKR